MVLTFQVFNSMSGMGQHFLLYMLVGIYQYLQRLSSKLSCDIYGKSKIYAITIIGILLPIDDSYFNDLYLLWELYFYHTLLTASFQYILF